ncbi:hypothetical protein IE81DRAFT_351412 [Ceraceosorus guamensis]|uniref:Uncharacterized protein n=1 Tax=Ceraceosorus guamensis TaxID=1522189 RepID=A0A316W3U2_9BASI|nr:hypothetical protein IE81DRAFT_351412 [Ceraceosorus guamensis]PWN44577.1 hypothetical protein IE81DRAFT_351412 [Ceraceosorus guamensis]
MCRQTLVERVNGFLLLRDASARQAAEALAAIVVSASLVHLLRQAQDRAGAAVTTRVRDDCFETRSTSLARDQRNVVISSLGRQRRRVSGMRVIAMRDGWMVEQLHEDVEAAVARGVSSRAFESNHLLALARKRPAHSLTVKMLAYHVDLMQGTSTSLCMQQHRSGGTVQGPGSSASKQASRCEGRKAPCDFHARNLRGAASETNGHTAAVRLPLTFPHASAKRAQERAKLPQSQMKNLNEGALASLMGGGQLGAAAAVARAATVRQSMYSRHASPSAFKVTDDLGSTPLFQVGVPTFSCWLLPHSLYCSDARMHEDGGPNGAQQNIGPHCSALHCIRHMQWRVQ